MIKEKVSTMIPAGSELNLPYQYNINMAVQRCLSR
jgi:hypothetical protein